MNGCDCGDYCEWCSPAIRTFSNTNGLDSKSGIQVGETVKVLEITPNGYARVEAAPTNPYAVNGTILIHPENLHV